MFCYGKKQVKWLGVYVVGVISLLILAGCSGQSMVSSNSYSEFRKSGNGMIVISASIIRRSANNKTKEQKQAFTTWRKIGSNYSFSTTGRNVAGDLVSAYEVPPGVYSLESFEGLDDRVIIEGNVRGRRIATMRVKAGEVAYVGHLQIKTHTKRDGTSGAFVRVKNNTNAARKMMYRNFPEFARKMRNRFVKVY